MFFLCFLRRSDCLECGKIFCFLYSVSIKVGVEFFDFLFIKVLFIVVVVGGGRGILYFYLLVG